MKKLYVLLLVCFFVSFTLNANEIQGKIIGISDGDTVTLLTEENEQVKIRLAAIDCPERKQDFGNRARVFTSDFCFGKHVIVKVDGKDHYGRVIGYIYVDKVCLNEELLKAGLAWHYKKYNNDVRLAELEQEARINKIGLWVMENPIEPWVFRKSKQSK